MPATDSTRRPAPASAATSGARGPEFWVLSLIFLVAVINYIDRQALSVAQPVIVKVFSLSSRDYGRLVFAFLLAYAIVQPISGRLLDRLGTVRGFAIAVVWWSIACALHAFASGAVSLAAYRFLLGVGEAALIPASIKTISEWLPVDRRQFGIGVMNAGISIGGVVSTPLIGWLLIEYGWRPMFVVTGALGCLWLGIWLAFMKDRQPLAEPAPPTRKTIPIAELIRKREIVGLVLSRVISDPAWYFYLFWLPAYLSSQRGFDMKSIAVYGWIPYATSTLGAVVSGWGSSRLLRSGKSVNYTRKAILLGAAALMPAGVLVGYVPGAWQAFAIVCLVTFLIQIWATALFAIPTDLFPASQVGSVVGFAAATGSASAMLFQLGVGEVVERFGYAPVFVTVALMHPLALACIHRFIPVIGRKASNATA